MIRIVKDSENIIVVTLYENSTVSNPIYLFELVNQQSNVKFYFISTDTSTNITRYNRFELIETENADTLNGEVELGGEGYYNYTVYQTDLLTLDGLTEASEAVPNIVKTVEVGLCFVEFNPIVNITYSPESNTNIVYQYDGLQ
mgnify:CR=1 FL=1|jgi:hypothetical protein